MEDIFVWMLVFAGAIIGLLGTFLVASERELKKKRNEAQDLADRINAAQNITGEAQAAQPAESASTTALLAKNQELSDEVASLSNRLQLNQTRSEALAAVQQEL